MSRLSITGVLRMNPLRFVNFLAANMDGVYAAIAEEVGRQLKRPIHYTPAQSSDDYDDAQVDVAFICGLPYVLKQQDAQPTIELLVAPVLCGQRYSEPPVYFSDVIVQQGSSYQTFEDLAGCRWAFNEEISYSGYRVVDYFLGQQGYSWDFFGDVVRAGSHQNAMKMVQEGRVDAAAIDSQAFAVEKIQRPELAEAVRVITSVGPSPMPPVVAASRLSPQLKAELRQTLLKMHQQIGMANVLRQGNIDHFGAVDDAHYDKIREVIA